jgi:hypothetical protein
MSQEDGPTASKPAEAARADGSDPFGEEWPMRLFKPSLIARAGLLGVTVSSDPVRLDIVVPWVRFGIPACILIGWLNTLAVSAYARFGAPNSHWRLVPGDSLLGPPRAAHLVADAVLIEILGSAAMTALAVATSFGRMTFNSVSRKLTLGTGRTIPFDRVGSVDVSCVRRFALRVNILPGGGRAGQLKIPPHGILVDFFDDRGAAERLADLIRERLRMDFAPAKPAA